MPDKGKGSRSGRKFRSATIRYAAPTQPSDTLPGSDTGCRSGLSPCATPGFDFGPEWRFTICKTLHVFDCSLLDDEP